jgi:hypothetical protein
VIAVLDTNLLSGNGIVHIDRINDGIALIDELSWPGGGQSYAIISRAAIGDTPRCHTLVLWHADGRDEGFGFGARCSVGGGNGADKHDPTNSNPYNHSGLDFD